MLMSLHTVYANIKTYMHIYLFAYVFLAFMYMFVMWLEFEGYSIFGIFLGVTGLAWVGYIFEMRMRK